MTKEMGYGQRLRWARKKANLTQEELAQISGVPQGTISKIERGDQASSGYDSILGHHLHIDSYWLTTGEGSPDPLSEGLVGVIVSEFSSLPDEGKREALRFLKFLSSNQSGDI